MMIRHCCDARGLGAELGRGAASPPAKRNGPVIELANALDLVLGNM